MAKRNKAEAEVEGLNPTVVAAFMRVALAYCDAWYQYTARKNVPSRNDMYLVGEMARAHDEMMWHYMTVRHVEPRDMERARSVGKFLAPVRLVPEAEMHDEIDEA